MLRAIDKWFAGYVRSVLARPARVTGARHLLFCFCDHFEPLRHGGDVAAARAGVNDWLASYADGAAGLQDNDGRPPRHTFFYPYEEYDPQILDLLGAFCRRGYGEVEIHLHHRHDTAAGLRDKLETFRDLLHRRHGLLGVNAEDGAVRYGFIHGNWALCNSRPDGDWCGVNEELGILAATGCYADFTFPSAPSPTQPRTVNSIYYAGDRPGCSRGADFGIRAARGARCDLPLLLIGGPLALDWSRRKWGVLPRLENGEISGTNPPTDERIRLWVRQWIHVAGQTQWVFVKVHTHGYVPANARTVLGESMRAAHTVLRKEFGDGADWNLHYVTAREMYNIVKAAEVGETGNPDRYRDARVVLAKPR
jgi:hypothetical protein